MQKPRGLRDVKSIVDWHISRAIPWDDCLVSHLAPNKKGYVCVSIGGRKGKKIRLHRLIFDVLGGEVAEDKQILHSCDNRACININHLYAGTAQDNTDDMLERKRSANQFGRGYGRNFAHPYRRFNGSRRV